MQNPAPPLPRQGHSFARLGAALTVLVLPGCGAGTAGQGANSDCDTICSRGKECGLTTATDCVAGCNQMLADDVHVLQDPAAQRYRQCVAEFVQKVRTSTCAQLQNESFDCFSPALNTPGCVDPGWAEYADGVCRQSGCSSEQQALCVGDVTAMHDRLPCLNSAAFGDRVSCQFSCANTVGISSSTLSCDSPATDEGATGGVGGLASIGGRAASTGGASTGGRASGGTGSPAGGASTGGVTGGCQSGAVVCPKPTQPMITDFTYVPPAGGASDAGASDVTFGDFTTTLSGGTLIYPTPALVSDVSASDWHITGTVGDYSGMALFFDSCALVDASAYRGISFTISGTIDAPTPNTLTMGVSVAADTIASSWYAAYDAGAVSPNCGTCVPASSNRYDGTCGDPQKAFTITPTAQTVTILWNEITGGKPAATVNPAEITSIYWYFPWSGSGQTPYTVDVTIDDLSFVE